MEAGVDSARTAPDRSAAEQGLAEFLVNNNNPRRALQVLDEAIKLNPANFDAFSSRGEALLDLSDATGAEAAYRRELEFAINRGDVYRGWAAALAARHRDEEALEKYRLANEADPWSPFALADAGRLLVIRGQLNAGAVLFTKALSVAPFRFSILNRWGAALDDRGEPKFALDRYRAAQKEKDVSLIRSNIAANEYKTDQYAQGERDYEAAVRGSTYPSRDLDDWAGYLIDHGHLQKARAVLTRAILADPTNTSPHIRLAGLLQRMGNIDEAKREFESASATAIYPSAVLENWAAEEASLGRFASAVAYLRQSVALDPENVNARIALARDLFALGSNQMAQRELLVAVESKISPASVHVAWGDMLYAKRNFSEAEEHFSTATQLAPALFSAWDGTMRSANQQGRYGAADAAAMGMLRASPADPQAYIAIANNLISVARYDDALKIYGLAALRFQSLGEPLIGKGELLIRLDRISEGRNALDTGLQREPRKVDLIRRCAEAFSSRGAFDLATHYYDKALEINPHSLDTLLGKAAVLAAARHPLDALKLCDRATETGSDNVSVLKCKADIFVSTGSYLKAIALYDQALSLEPTLIDLYISKAQAYLGMESGEKDALRTLWEAQRRNLSSAELHRELGNCLCRKKETFTFAADQFQQAINDNPNAPWLLIDFADCLATKGQWNAVSDLYRKALNMSFVYIPYYGQVNQAPMYSESVRASVRHLREVMSQLAPDVQISLGKQVPRLETLPLQ